MLKPFRTVEDIHVIAAAAGWLVRVAREAGWPPPVRQRLLATVAALRGLGAVRPDSPGVHVALGGVLDEFERLLGELAPRWDAAMRADLGWAGPTLDMERASAKGGS
ncbi:Uncharacterised protein [Mycobacteroides abscessus subsp. abscessus]|nr:Uncharacterised protein [Mycobacteroides abscessus subsp. abscessus]